MAYRPARPSPPPPHAHYLRNGLPGDSALAVPMPFKVHPVQTVKQTTATCCDSPFLSGPPPPPSKSISKLTTSALNSHHMDHHLAGHCSNSSDCSARSNSGARPALYGEAGVGGFGSWSRCGVATTPPRGSPSHPRARPHSAVVSRCVSATTPRRSPSAGRPEEVIRLAACAAEEEIMDDSDDISTTGEVQEQEAAPRPFANHGDLCFQVGDRSSTTATLPVCSSSSVEVPPTYVNKYRKYVQSYRKQNEYLPENSSGGTDHIGEGGEVEKPLSVNRHRGGEKGPSHRGRSTTVKDYRGGPSLQSKRAWLSERQEKHIRRAARRRSTANQKGGEAGRDSSSSSVSSTSSSSS